MSGIQVCAAFRFLVLNVSSLTPLVAPTADPAFRDSILPSALDRGPRANQLSWIESPPLLPFSS